MVDMIHHHAWFQVQNGLAFHKHRCTYEYYNTALADCAYRCKTQYILSIKDKTLFSYERCQTKICAVISYDLLILRNIHLDVSYDLS